MEEVVKLTFQIIFLIFFILRWFKDFYFCGFNPISEPTQKIIKVLTYGVDKLCLLEETQCPVLKTRVPAWVNLKRPVPAVVLFTTEQRQGDILKEIKSLTVKSECRCSLDLGVHPFPILVCCYAAMHTRIYICSKLVIMFWNYRFVSNYQYHFIETV